MDVNKNSYTIGFATIMVVIVAALLSIASIALKPYQAKNIELEKKQNILRSVGIEKFVSSEKNIDLFINDNLISLKKNDTIFLKKSDKVEFTSSEGEKEEYKDVILVSREISEIFYPSFIKEELVVNYLGEIQEGSAFDVDLSKELKKDISEQQLPLYIAEVDGNAKYIIPLRGAGLWGPVWGFLAFNEDLDTVSAAVFDHKLETPGLGAEINKASFQNSFSGKTIFEGVEFTSIEVVKAGNSKGDIHKVDGISGGTITSVGVSDMIKERLERYLPYFKILSPEMQVEEVLNIVDEDEKSDTTSSTMNEQNKTSNDYE